MNNDKLALTLADKLMAKVNSLLDAEVRTITADLQDTQKDIEAKRTISIKVGIKVTSDHRGITIDAESNHGIPKRELEPVVYPIDVNNSGQINLFEDE
ncbi:hypothetical protein ACFC90_07760 [Enterococcus casseliflavus]|uniref:hypothetical protein n=1 Tax=Enterococcus casseliflavus TaxID=37734 RepID=UPI0039A71CDF